MLGLIGVPAAVVARPLDFAPAEKLVTCWRSKSGNAIIPKLRSARALLRVLKNQGVAALLLDQNVDWYDGEWVDFFGRPACSNKGMALLARAYDAPVIPAYLHRAPDGKFDLRIEPPIPVVKTSDKTKDVWQNTQNYTKALENAIRRYPEQWFWAAPAVEDQTIPRLAQEMTMPKPLDANNPRRILVRGTNWVGDAVMTLPALAALKKACPRGKYHRIGQALGRAGLCLLPRSQGPCI
jgi:hypothetical protein